jgi:hypothetical protein
MAAIIDNSLLDLNSNPNFDFLQSQNAYLTADDNLNPYKNIEVNSHYYDVSYFTATFNNSTLPIILNINIQSLTSKIDNLKALISTFHTKQTYIPVISLQEVWQIPFPEVISLPGYNFIHKQRSSGRGGEWVSTSHNPSHLKYSPTYPLSMTNPLSPLQLKSSSTIKS